MPYITASIILQLGRGGRPHLAQLQKEGEAATPRSTSTPVPDGMSGRRQAVGYSYLFRRQHILTANTGRLV
jgi:hypothetical protein